ncbi:glutaredoxin-like protein C5orf63 homolog [Scomber scombrus]|uniref:glutaredoxin-like protein C5orf63 homolog n=1 Tax=Scomber scombrus TaxID=13677 RepID=UPI002DDA30A7|nr:glutaredoxin-like protein C5orf63 homolog [Scomber scombrus]
MEAGLTESDAHRTEEEETDKKQPIRVNFTEPRGNKKSCRKLHQTSVNHRKLKTSSRRSADLQPVSDPCPLCDEAKEVLQPFRHRFVFQQVDISHPENRKWLDRYRWDIPVFHLNGQFVMKHRVDIVLLDKLLQDAETQKT